MSSTCSKNKAICHLTARAISALCVVIFAGACVTQKKTTTAYSEDLSPNRPTFAFTEPAAKTTEPDAPVRKVAPTHNVNKKVDNVLDSIDRINLTKKFLDGYTIQVYSGQKRDDAMNVKQRMVVEAGDLPSSIQYVQPKFRVTVGNYLTRMEAQKDLMRLKKIFSAAILVPEKIALK